VLLPLMCSAAGLVSSDARFCIFTDVAATAPAMLLLLLLLLL
jgi:hypothetical protein